MAWPLRAWMGDVLMWAGIRGFWTMRGRVPKLYPDHWSLYGYVLGDEVLQVADKMPINTVKCAGIVCNKHLFPCSCGWEVQRNPWCNVFLADAVLQQSTQPLVQGVVEWRTRGVADFRQPRGRVT